jgi:anti-sigma regulatory factor (Ser/Thr protein kinase)
MTHAARQTAARPYPALPARTPTFTPSRKMTPPRAAGPAADHHNRPGTYARADLTPEPAAAGQARRLTRDALTRWGMSHLTDDAQAIASELASNAVNHAVAPRPTMPAIIFAVHQQPGQITITVWDNGPGQPLLTHPGPDAENGRGLEVIDDLTACNWGWWPTPNSGGKVVYATLPAPDADDPRDLAARFIP